MVIDMVTGVIIGFATLEATVKTMMLYFAYRHIFVDLYSRKLS
ncbi:MAG: hypothetical protein VKL59_14080 [Nostocaceae cyanobacterium]|nr:hypothetical protein [Nostocaceae cyanobacterium]